MKLAQREWEKRKTVEGEEREEVHTDLDKKKKMRGRIFEIWGMAHYGSTSPKEWAWRL